MCIRDRYSIDGERLIIESGLFQKKRRELPLANITTVDFTQSLIFQMAGVYAVHVDTNSSIGSGDSGQVKMVLNGKDAIFVKKLLLARQQDLREDRISEEISGNTVMASPGELVLMLSLIHILKRICNGKQDRRREYREPGPVFLNIL